MDELMKHGVKKLEKTVKTSQARRRANIVVFGDEEDEKDSSKQGRSLIEDMDMDAGISLVPPHVADQGRFDDTQVSDQPEEQLGVFSAAKVLVDVARKRRGIENVHTYTRRGRAVSTASGEISTAEESVSTVGASMPVSTAGMDQGSIPSPSASKDKGKALHEEEQARFNAEQESKFLDEEESQRIARDAEVAQRLQEEIDASERQRMAQVHQAAQGFTDAEWNDILARVAADEDLLEVKKLKRAGQEVFEEPAKSQKIREALGDDLVKLWSLVYERFNSTELTDDKEKELWFELKRLFEPDENDTLWKLQRYMNDPLTWKLYDTCGVHRVSTERGHDNFMLVKKDYPLIRELMTIDVV
ncbi:hypothetical protein Tco_0780809 [Tanacetum coccineum]